MLLAIDTATDLASVALGQPGDKEPLEENLLGARRHAAALIPMVESLLRRAGASLDDVRGIALSDGPGSFTGLRVGAAMAKALVHARRLSLWVAPSLLVRAAGAAQDNRVVLAISSALRGEVYAAAYRFVAEGIHTVLAPSVRTPDELMMLSVEPDVVVGDATAEILSRVEKWTGRPVIGPSLGSPHAARLLGLVGRSGGARLVDSVAQWEPVYGRPAEAQARWEMVHGRPLPDPVGSPR
jgi:tRNA threonylcarbamoyladenosine biosynthesis protein TsaB